MSPIMDALSKALLKEMTARVNKRIAEILGKMDNSQDMQSVYSWALF